MRGRVERLSAKAFCAVVSAAPAGMQPDLTVTVQKSIHRRERDAMAACAEMIVTATRAIRARGDRVAQVELDAP